MRKVENVQRTPKYPNKALVVERMMCPNCEAEMKQKGGYMICPSCGYVEERRVKSLGTKKMQSLRTRTNIRKTF